MVIGAWEVGYLCLEGCFGLVGESYDAGRTGDVVKDGGGLLVRCGFLAVAGQTALSRERCLGVVDWLRGDVHGILLGVVGGAAVFQRCFSGVSGVEPCLNAGFRSGIEPCEGCV